jgi:putative ABC transport system substrate-binding protein
LSKKILCLAQVALLFALCFSAEAQQPPKVHRVGFLRRSYPQAADFEPFRHGLVELGYVEGKNLIVEQRYADGLTDRLSGLAAELVGLNVEVIVVDGTITAQAAKAATETIPIVFTIVWRPSWFSTCEKPSSTGRQPHRSHAHFVRIEFKAAGAT